MTERQTAPTRLLLVDDDEDDYLIVRNFIAKLHDNDAANGFELEWIRNYEDAQVSIERGEHDIYLIDYRLGADNGLELLEKLNIQERPQPFIILTGAGDQRIERKAMRIGVADYLVKGSFDAELLSRVLHYSLQRKLLEEQRLQHFIEINRSKDEFISLASHQLRTPATVVKQYLAMVMDGYVGDVTEDQRLMLARAYEGNELQLRIVNDLLHVATLDAGRVHLQKTPVDPASLVKEAVRGQQTTFASRRQKAEVKTAADLKKVHVDELKLRMVVDNLIDNASKYSDEGTQITADVYCADDKLHIAIRDQGVGMSEDEIGKLFQKFSRLPNRLSAEVGGSGLGLYWAWQIIELHGGRIDVTSEASKGSTFTIVLPA